MSHMTKLDGVPDADDAKPGMAYFAGTGPVGKSCGSCKHRGYQRLAKPRLNKRTNKMVERAFRWGGCAVFRRLSQGRAGPEVERDWKACKYYEPRHSRE